MEWINVEDRLPCIDEYVLWRHENGFIFMECVDKDWNGKYFSYFLSGYGNKETNGRITHWMPLLEPHK